MPSHTAEWYHCCCVNSCIQLSVSFHPCVRSLLLYVATYAHYEDNLIEVLLLHLGAVSNIGVDGRCFWNERNGLRHRVACLACAVRTVAVWSESGCAVLRCDALVVLMRLWPRAMCLLRELAAGSSCLACWTEAGY